MHVKCWQLKRAAGEYFYHKNSISSSCDCWRQQLWLDSCSNYDWLIDQRMNGWRVAGTESPERRPRRRDGRRSRAAAGTSRWRVAPLRRSRRPLRADAARPPPHVPTGVVDVGHAPAGRRRRRLRRHTNRHRCRRPGAERRHRSEHHGHQVGMALSFNDFIPAFILLVLTFRICLIHTRSRLPFFNFISILNIFLHCTWCLD